MRVGGMRRAGRNKMGLRGERRGLCVFAMRVGLID